MFTDLKNIKEEINLFKRNMDSVDGLMSATKEVCGKMDHQINQAEQVLANFSSFRQEQSEGMQNFTQQIANEMTRIDVRFISNQQETQQSLDKQKLELIQLADRFAKDQQLIQQSLDMQKLELKQLVENLVKNQQLLQQSLEKQKKEMDIIAEKAEVRHTRLTVITVIGFFLLALLLIVT